jgi:hypothetical protein
MSCNKQRVTWRTRRGTKTFTISHGRKRKIDNLRLDSTYPGAKVRCMKIMIFSCNNAFAMPRIHSKRTKAALLLAACDGRCKMGDVGSPLFQGGSLLRCAAFAVNRAFFHSPPSGVRIQRLPIIKQLRLKRCEWCLSITASRCGG